MSTPTKEWLSKWLPVIITMMGWCVLYGMQHQEVINLRAEMMPMEKRLEIFYTRREAQTMEALIRDTNAKVDVIFQREIAKR